MRVTASLLTMARRTAHCEFCSKPTPGGEQSENEHPGCQTGLLEACLHESRKQDARHHNHAADVEPLEKVGRSENGCGVPRSGPNLGHPVFQGHLTSRRSLRVSEDRNRLEGVPQKLKGTFRV